ncbi:MAG: invasion associated locus B family protein [Proteobacteria bacterium]|nr:invasion associated locus B family protein [Pseudomonadota bacterium]
MGLLTHEDIMIRFLRHLSHTVLALALSGGIAPKAIAQDIETFGAWTKFCNGEGEAQTCLISQVLQDTDGNNVAEVSIADVIDGGDTVGAISIATPLNTLLLPGVRFKVDEFDESRLPFNFCQPGGCVVQIGLTQDNIDAFIGATAAAVTIVPVATPNTEVALTLSFEGFTTAFTSLQPE